MGSNTEVKIFDSPKNVYKAIAKEILIISAHSTQPRINIVLAGGKSPMGLFKRLGKKYAEAIPWKRIHFWWGDERCVPPDSEESNYKMAADHLFSRINIPAENIHRIKGENDPEKEAFAYAQEIDKNLNKRGENPVFDLIILGIGDDGHTASIFPDNIELLQDEKICAVARHPITGQKRITLTGRVLNSANQIFFMVTGNKKSLRIGEIMNDNDAARLLPAYYISPENGSLTWYLDEDAAHLI